MKLIKIVSVTCGSCEKWAVGIDCGGDLYRGRCTSFESLYHNQIMESDQSCPQWAPIDEDQATRH